jgi:hypothetical protein
MHQCEPDGAVNGAMVWSMADGAMGGGFIMVKASNFACKKEGIEETYSSVHSLRIPTIKNDANRNLACISIETITNFVLTR